MRLTTPFTALSAPLLLALLSACQTAPPAAPVPPTSPEVVGELRAGSGYLKGYLDRKQLPNSLALLPKPPADGSPQQLADHQCLIYTQDNSARSGHAQWLFETVPGKVTTVNVRGKFDATDGRAHRQFALAGLGITYVPRPIVQEDLAVGDLVSVLDECMPRDVWLMAVYSQRRHNSAALRALLDFLQQRLSGD